jgi:hypothetical protein
MAYFIHKQLLPKNNLIWVLKLHPEDTIEQFETTTPNNSDISVSHLNHMRDAIIRTWSLREDRLKQIAKETSS